MKKINYMSFLLILVLSFLISANLSAENKDNQGKHKNTSMQKITDDPGQSLIDVNQITCWTRNDGYHDWVVGGSWDGAFPNGVNAGAIFSEGIVWGGLVSDGGSQLVRVNGNTYSTGCAPITRLFRVRPDYQTGDLTQDAADFNSLAVTSVTSSDIQALRAQYAKDWNEWPGNSGAPYEDVDGNGSYDPSVDIPGIPGASQTLFIRYNDDLSAQNYGSQPIGLEVSETYWAYAAAGGLGNVIFKKVDIIYKGNPGVPADSRIDDMYIVQWADPDVGNSTDDFAGCDTTLNLGYAYSSGFTDAVYQGLNLAPPAVGYDFLQGVSHYTGNPNDSAIFNLKWRHGYAYINPKPMSSYAYFAAGGTWSDPAFTYTGTQEFYNLMRGVKPDPPYPAGEPFPPSVADVTPFGTYLLDGDPVFGTGKIDGTVDGPGDRRIMVTNGPISMELNDTAEVVLALIGGLGSNNISSISVLKYNDLFAQYAFDQLFNIPLMPKPDLQAYGTNDKVLLNWGSNTDSTLIDQIENQSHGVYKFQGYSVYQLPPGGTDINQGVRIATYDIVDTVTVLFDKVLDEGTGLIISKPIVVLTNSGLQRYLEVTQDKIFNKPLANGLSYTFAVTAIAYNQDPNLPANILESAPAIVNVTPQTHAPGITFQSGESQDFTHSGSANASINIKVINPSEVTGDQYQLFFTTQSYQLGADHTWTPVGSGKRLGKDLTGSSITSAASWGEKDGTMDVHYTVNVVDTTTFDWCDGVELFLPSNVTIDTSYNPTSNNDGSLIQFTINRTNNSIFYGDSSRDGNGKFAGGEEIIVTVKPTDLPMVTNYNMYDDNYGGILVDISGTDTLQGPIATKMVTQKQWNIKDLKTGQIVVHNQTILDGVDIYAPSIWFKDHFYDGPGGSSHSFNANVGVGANPIFDGIQVALSGSYSAPTTLTSPTANLSLNGNSMTLSTLTIGETGGAINWHNSAHTYAITDFTIYGFADGTARSSLSSYNDGTTVGVPLTDINDLQQDYELRWTGVLGDTTIGGTTVRITKSGGQLVTKFGASGYDLADDPLNPNPGSSAPFLVRVPFEVWNVDKNEQVNLLYWDRSGDGSTSWVQDNRQYTWIVNNAYDPSAPLNPNGGVVADSATWNVVIYVSDFTLGDVVTISYPNPLQVGQDTFTFSTEQLAYKNATAKDEVKMINVFPNPYYGFQYRESSRDQHYVTFSHLPTKATIRIFDLSGVLVKTIDHSSAGSPNSQFDTWNLQNDGGYPVASGIYVVYIDMPDLGTTKILKLAVIQEQQILKVY